MKRALAVSGAILLLAIVVVAVPLLTVLCRAVPRNATPEERAVYRAVLARENLLHERQLVVAECHVWPEDGQPVKAAWDRRRSAPDVAYETLLDFSVKARAGGTIREFPGVHLVARAELDPLFRPDSFGGWQRLRDAYPESRGFVLFSRVGFNGSGTQAIVWRSNCRSWCGTGASAYLLLSKSSDGWRVVKEYEQ